MMEEFLSYEGVGVSQRALWQSEKRRIIFQIERNGVVAVELCRGSPEEYPARSLILGLVLMLPGYFPVWHLIDYLRTPGAGIHLAGFRYEAAMTLIAGIGIWLVYRAIVMRSYYLRVKTDKLSRKLVFSSKVTQASVLEFLEKGRNGFGLEYMVRNDERMGSDPE